MYICVCVFVFVNRPQESDKTYQSYIKWFLFQRFCFAFCSFVWKGELRDEYTHTHTNKQKNITPTKKWWRQIFLMETIANPLFQCLNHHGVCIFLGFSVIYKQSPFSFRVCYRFSWVYYKAEKNTNRTTTIFKNKSKCITVSLLKLN